MSEVGRNGLSVELNSSSAPSLVGDWPPPRPPFGEPPVARPPGDL
jgi:hypothetical protein